MNPRNIGNFLKSKFGLFIVFVVVLFSGLAIYGRQQAQEREAAKLAAQSTKKVELGHRRSPSPSLRSSATGDLRSQARRRRPAIS